MFSFGVLVLVTQLLSFRIVVCSHFTCSEKVVGEMRKKFFAQQMRRGKSRCSERATSIICFSFFFTVCLFSSPHFTRQSSCRFEDGPDVILMTIFLMLPKKCGLVIDI